MRTSGLFLCPRPDCGMHEPMDSIRVQVDASQFPGNIERELADALLEGWVPSKFHYGSYRQSQLWIQLAQLHSPYRRSEDGLATYRNAFHHAAAAIPNGGIVVAGLGCGDGAKEALLLQCLNRSESAFIACDSSLPLLIRAATNATRAGARIIEPFLCDISRLASSAFRQHAGGSSLFVTMFGVLPNLRPSQFFHQLPRLLDSGDHLLLSANLDPDPGSPAGMRQVFESYDNTATRQWLSAFLIELAIERQTGPIQFLIEECPEQSGLRRVAASCAFIAPAEVHLDGRAIEFEKDSVLRLFFSYRHTPDWLAGACAKAGLELLHTWTSADKTEGLFFCRKA